MDEDRLPAPALVLIGVATALLWILLLVLLVALLIAGPGATGAGVAEVLAMMFGVGSQIPLSIAIQQGVGLLTFAVIWLSGSVVLWFTIVGDHGRARRVTLWLVWAMITLTIVGTLAAAAPVVEFGGSVWSSVPILLTRLPIMLIEIALLFCAVVYLRKPPPSVF